MKKIIASCLFLICVILPSQAQIYTPTGAIQGTSGNDNVGIGTTTPAGKLHINNAGINGQLDYNLIVQKTEVADSNKSAVGLLFSAECCGAFGKSAIVHERTGGYGIGNLHFLNSNAIDISNPTLLDTKMTINSNGNVGVGTINPLAKFEVNKGNVLVKNAINTDNSSSIMISQSIIDGDLTSFGTSIRTITQSGGNNTYGMQLFTQESYLTGQTEKIRILGNGNVGIGTTNPTSKLTVAGNINSREVKVTVDAGADFVFEKDYDLPSLSSIENYIKENKHLPEIASAKEMKANGINLSEMNIKLLQKMEEITLYVIEQNKQIKILKNENEYFRTLSERLTKLEKLSEKR